MQINQIMNDQGFGIGTYQTITNRVRIFKSKTINSNKWLSENRNKYPACPALPTFAMAPQIFVQLVAVLVLVHTLSSMIAQLLPRKEVNTRQICIPKKAL